MTGIWISISTLVTGETRIHYTIFSYPGVVSFLVVDVAIFIATATLSTVQASQVTYLPFCFSILFLFPITVEELTFDYY